jgi:hypothetical protein
MTPEQAVALVATIGGLPLLIKIAEKWFEGRGLKLRTDQEEQKYQEEREWKALQESLNRERDIYTKFITDQKVDFEQRLGSIESKLAKIQEEAQNYQRLYWEERVKREGLQARVDYLEYQLSVMEKIANARGNVG